MVAALSAANRESELSYAYLHAVAAHAGVNCRIGNRHEDNNGIDATLTAWGAFPGGGIRTEVTINVQLKATIGLPVDDGIHLSYSLSGINQYNDLRSETLSVPRILAVLFLPREEADWVHHSSDCLKLQKCAYWVSLRGAPPSTNSTSQTIYIPKTQMFNSTGLVDILSKLSRLEDLNYELPA
ncbi:DUF4365 domain-containing protein [Pseudomonas aeruginosa]|jgi:hypothetical protein|uniref:DUF4365 domain-containing protein n=1 Tax=Pseudomonas TaxID=286 RepID=UPI000A1043A4|nr:MULTISPECIES: DUF4365 domain-containing protein [Pseudomonas]MBF8779984.1 DUF4365 domain-containing protein [Pseudomonas fulva]ORL70401.1 hypothetical protein B7H19_05700 [Pseudomonas putida]RTU01370.1 DUF4365 domain-containing protein [Pseudomonas aeruginosa]CAB5575039.1 Uncharacterised protein [Pseudomonas putida]CAB5636725.1 Uncharacterised protein [Pseudomonas putida]